MACQVLSKEAIPVLVKVHAIPQEMLESNIPMSDVIPSLSKTVAPECFICFNNLTFNDGLYFSRRIDDIVMLTDGFFSKSFIPAVSMLSTMLSTATFLAISFEPT